MAAVVFSTDVDDSGQGLDGTIRNNAWKQAMAANINAVIGDWTTVAFSAGNFTASAGSWTVTSGQVLYNNYFYFNHTLFWSCNIAASAVTSTPLKLQIASPFASAGPTLTSPYATHPVAFAGDNGVVTPCLLRPQSSYVVEIVRVDGANFHVTAASTSIIFSVWFQTS